MYSHVPADSKEYNPRHRVFISMEVGGDDYDTMKLFRNDILFYFYYNKLTRSYYPHEYTYTNQTRYIENIDSDKMDMHL